MGNTVHHLLYALLSFCCTAFAHCVFLFFLGVSVPEECRRSPTETDWSHVTLPICIGNLPCGLRLVVIYNSDLFSRFLLHMGMLGMPLLNVLASVHPSFVNCNLGTVAVVQLVFSRCGE